MDIKHKRLLIAAQGYSELGLHDLALDELQGIPAAIRDEPGVIETHLSVLMQAKRYRDALPLARKLCQSQPEKPTGYIHTAFCLHELGDTAAARDLLLGGPGALKAEPTFHYNLACYETALGNLEQARTHLHVSFAMDKKLRDYALEDPDLRPLREVGALQG